MVSKKGSIIAVKVPIVKLETLPLPALVQITVSQKYYFSVLRKNINNVLEFLHPVTDKWTATDWSRFEIFYAGIALFTEVSDKDGPKNRPKQFPKERKERFKIIATGCLIPLVTLAACFYHLLTDRETYISVFIFLMFCGTIIGLLLLLYGIDKFNPVLRQICGISKKKNCNAILSSKKSTFFGISWSEWGTSYFLGGLLLLLLGTNDKAVLGVLGWLAIFSSCYILFSVYYQWKIMKQWCTLCVASQIVLALQLITALMGKFISMQNMQFVDVDSILRISGVYFFTFILVTLIVPLAKKAKEYKIVRIELHRLKYDDRVWDALLNKQKKLTHDVKNLGITLGSKQPAHHIIKVCNPYCAPCAKAHFVIEALLDDHPDLQVQIIFTATGNEDDNKTPPVKHLMAIYATMQEHQTKAALNDWYKAEKKEYLPFSEKYPMNEAMDKQIAKIKEMREWCEKTEIISTPTFFIDGHQLPDIYTFDDLKFFL